MIDDTEILRKLDRLESWITIHVITEIKTNREQISGMYQTIMQMYDSMQHNTENISCIADRLNQIHDQLRRVNVID